MELPALFEKMIAKLNDKSDDMVLAPFMRERLLRQFGYFHLQSLCDFDRRQDPKVIAMHWEMLKQNRQARFIIERQASDAKTWPIIANFVSDREIYSNRRPTPQPETDPPVRQFFIDLMVRVSKNARLPLVELGLRYLATECKLRPTDRDSEAIRGVWKTIWPELNRLGFLTEFRTDAVLKTRVQNFVANGYYFEKPGGGGITHNLEKTARRGTPDHDYSGRRGIDFRNAGLNDSEVGPITARGLSRTLARSKF